MVILEKHKMVSLLIMSTKLYKGMKMLERKILNNTTIVVRFKGGVKYLIHQDGVLLSDFFEEVPDADFESTDNPFYLLR